MTSVATATATEPLTGSTRVAIQHRHAHADGQGCRAEDHHRVDHRLVTPARDFFHDELGNEHA